MRHPVIKAHMPCAENTDYQGGRMVLQVACDGFGHGTIPQCLGINKILECGGAAFAGGVMGKHLAQRCQIVCRRGSRAPDAFLL